MSSYYVINDSWTNGTDLFEISLSPLENGFHIFPSGNISIGIPALGRDTYTWSVFTIAQITKNHEIRIILRPTRKGRVSDYLANKSNLHKTVKVQPASSPLIKTKVERATLLAAGSGLGASIGTAFSIRGDNTKSIHLLHVTRGGDPSLLPSAQLLLQDHRIQMDIWDTSSMRRPTPEDFYPIIESTKPNIIHICGPQTFSDYFKSKINTVKTSNTDIIIDRFQNERAPQPEKESAKSQESAMAEIIINGERTNISWPQEESLLDCLLKNDISVPYSCKAGICSACQCRVIAGNAHTNSDLGLSEKEREMGLKLACQLFPIDRELTIQFSSPHIHEDIE